jgi:hypothetical protein
MLLLLLFFLGDDGLQGYAGDGRRARREGLRPPLLNGSLALMDDKVGEAAKAEFTGSRR